MGSVKRSMMKKGIIAALVFQTCIEQGFTRTRAEAAMFAKLSSHGIARGDDFLRSIDEDRGLDIDMNKDRLRPHITTIFALLDLGGGGSHAAEVSARCHIRIHTIRRFLAELASYHSHFEETYRAHGLSPRRAKPYHG